MAISASYDAVFATPLSGVKLGLRMDGAALVCIDFLDARAADIAPRAAAARAAAAELHAYFAAPRHAFTLPLRLEGTTFQQRVWAALCEVPAGGVVNYGALATSLRTAPRAIGGACRANPVPIVVPCHRVVGKTGWGGFMGREQGHALTIKRWLLRHEGCHLESGGA